MVKVAITGGIGSGKSYVCRALEKRGIAVYDCDMAAKRLMATSVKIQSDLKRVVGNEVFCNGVLNKKVLTGFLLESDENMQMINNIVHPAVAADFISSGYTWMECAILFSSGFDKLVDKVLCVTAPLDVRIERIVFRDGISKEKALEWINKQLPQETISAQSDFIIINDGTRDIEEQINNILASLKEL